MMFDVEVLFLLSAAVALYIVRPSVLLGKKRMPDGRAVGERVHSLQQSHVKLCTGNVQSTKLVGTWVHSYWVCR
jgi:hypothetical protein